MALVINWVDRNITVDKFRVYRSDTVILDTALPTPLAEVAAGTFSYLDATAVRNQTYHYRIGVVANGEETLSADMALAYMPYTGPGPQKLLRGDWSYGTFGRIAVEDLFGPAELCQIVGLGAQYAAAGGYAASWWIKIVYNGKILFIPDRAIANGSTALSWATLYQLGLVYGKDDPSTWSAAAKSTYGTIQQGVTVQKNADTFLVRLPGTRVGSLTASSVPANQVGGEYDQIISPLYLTRTSQVNPIQLDDLTWVANCQAYTKDVTTTAGDTIIFRPDGSVNPDPVLTAALAYSYIYTAWRPILELVF
jgi:hypothetical protein